MSILKGLAGGGGGGSGSVTEIDTGTGLTGGPITGTGTISVANSTINSLAGFNNSGVFSDVIVSTGLTLTGGVITSSGSGGTVTNIATGTGLTGGPITGTGTISIGNTAVSPASYGSSTSIPSFTVNQQGQLTAASGNVVIAPAGTLSGTTLNSTVVTSSLTTVGTIGTGTWQGTAVAPTYGGTGQDTHAATGVAQVSSGTWSVSSALANGTTATTQTSSDNSTKVATTAYVTIGITNALNGLDWKPAVQWATTTNQVGTNVAGVFTYTSTGTQTVDGRTQTLNDVFLFKNQITTADNGVWVVTTAGALGVAGVLTRRSDYNTAADIQPGDTFYCINGTVNANTAWVQTDTVVTINTDPLAFSQVAGPGSYVAGTGLTLTGNSFSVNASQTQVTAVGTLTTGAIGSGFTAIPNSALANDTISGIALGNNLDTLTFGTHLASGGSSYNGSAGVTITSDATSANTASTIVARDSSGNFSAGTITANLTGTASLATTAADLSISGQTGLLTFTGLTSTNRAKTVRDAADTILELGGSYTPTGTWTSLTMVTPVLGTPTSGTLTNCTGLPVAGGGTGATTAATARSNLGVAAVGGTYLGDAVTGAQTITLIEYAAYAFTINSLQNLGTVAGTVTGTLNINGTPVTGCSSLSLTTSPQTGTATAANSVAAGNTVTFVTSSPSSLTGLLPFSLIGTR